MRELYPRISILVSSRRTTENLIDPHEEAIELGAMSKADVQRFVESDLPAPMAKRLLQMLPNWDPSLTSNPLLLHLAIRLFDQHAELPKNIDGLVAGAFDALWSRHDSAKGQFVRLRRSPIDQDVARRLLGRIALYFLGYDASTIAYASVQSFLSGILRAETAGSVGALPVVASDVLEDFVEIGILHREEEGILFLHRAFLEHFALIGASQLDLAGEDFAAVVLILINRGIDVDRIVDAVSDWPHLLTDHIRCRDIMRQRASAGEADMLKVEAFLKGLALKVSDRKHHKAKLSDILGGNDDDLPPAK